MPRNPEWIHHIPGALTELEVLGLPFVDRAGIERLLHLSPRQALRLMHKFGAIRAGRDLLLERVALCETLRCWGSSEETRLEIARFERVHERLSAIRKELAGRRIKIVAPVASGPLPPETELSSETLQIGFHGIQDLLGKLLGLSQAIMNDVEGFQRLCGS